MKNIVRTVKTTLVIIIKQNIAKYTYNELEWSDHHFQFIYLKMLSNNCQKLLRGLFKNLFLVITLVRLTKVWKVFLKWRNW